MSNFALQRSGRSRALAPGAERGVIPMQPRAARWRSPVQVKVIISWGDLRMGPSQGSSEPQEAWRLLRGGGSIFLDALALTFWDPDHSEAEEREITIGRSAEQRILFVAHTAREDRIRIISARQATSQERRQYEEGIDEATR